MQSIDKSKIVISKYFIPDAFKLLLGKRGCVGNDDNEFLKSITDIVNGLEECGVSRFRTSSRRTPSSSQATLTKFAIRHVVDVKLVKWLCAVVRKECASPEIEVHRAPRNDQSLPGILILCRLEFLLPVAPLLIVGRRDRPQVSYFQAIPPLSSVVRPPSSGL